MGNDRKRGTAEGVGADETAETEESERGLGGDGEGEGNTAEKAEVSTGRARGGTPTASVPLKRGLFSTM